MEASTQIDESAEKRGRGRPRKTDEDSALAKEKTKKLAKEIRVALGRSGKLMPIGELLDELKKIGFGGAESLWRKYEAGNDAMSPGRMFELASFAYSKGARGEAVKDALLRPWHDLHQTASVENQALEEAELTKMTESIKAYLLVVDPLRIMSTERIESAVTKFNKMIDLAKKMAFEAYSQAYVDPASEEHWEEAKGHYYVDHDGEIEEFEDDNFLVKSPSSPLVVAVPKPVWARNKKA